MMQPHTHRPDRPRPWRVRLRTSIGLLPFLALLALIGIPAETSEATHLDLPSCIDAAAANSPRLTARTAQLSVRESMAQVRQAQRLPDLSFRGETGYLDGYAITPFALLRNVTEEGLLNRRVDGTYYQAVADLRVPLVGGGRNSELRRARDLVSESQWAVEAERSAVAATVAEAYAEALKHRDALRTHEARVKLFESDIGVARARFEQDLISENDVLTAEVRLETARRDLALARLGLQNSFDALSTAMGLPVGRVLALEEFPDEPEPTLTREELSALMREHHPIVKAQLHNVKAQNEYAKSLRSGRYPAVDLDVRYGLGNAFDDINDQTEWQFQAAVMAKVPLFNFGLDRKQAGVAQARQVEATRGLAILRLAADQELAAIYAVLEQSEAELDLIDAQIAQAEAEVKLHEAMVKENLTAEAELHESQMKLQMLQLDRRTREYDRKLAHYRLKLLQEAAGSRLK